MWIPVVFESDIAIAILITVAGAALDLHQLPDTCCGA
jgi:hypothetical protein